MQRDALTAAAVAAGFAFGAALGYRSTVNLNRTELVRYGPPGVADRW